MSAEYRKIIHIDMDAFYASVEQRDFPEYRGKPIAVGGGSKRGVVAAASYEARKFGVYSAMPSVTAKRRCPHLIFVKPRFLIYREVSLQIRAIFHQYTNLVEPLSLDEAYLDVTTNFKKMPSATLIAKAIRQQIKAETQLTASAGVSFNKFLAKVASDVNKPDGLKVITPQEAAAFIDKLPIKKFHGIGKVTAAKMNKMGIYTGADLRQRTEQELLKKFGKVGRYYYHIVRGNDQRKVQPNRIRKSLSAENTFFDDITAPEDLLNALKKITETVAERLKKIDAAGKTVTVKIKYYDFTQTTRSKTVNQYLQHANEIFPIVQHLIQHPAWPAKPVRLLGVGLSKLDTDEPQQLGRQLTFDF